MPKTAGILIYNTVKVKVILIKTHFFKMFFFLFLQKTSEHCAQGNMALDTRDVCFTGSYPSSCVR